MTFQKQVLSVCPECWAESMEIYWDSAYHTRYLIRGDRGYALGHCCPSEDGAWESAWYDIPRKMLEKLES